MDIIIVTKLQFRKNEPQKKLILLFEVSQK